MTAGAHGFRPTGGNRQLEMLVSRRVRWVAFSLLLILVSLEAGCYVYAPGPPGPPASPPHAVWVPGHYNRFGAWVQGHWR